MALQVTKEEQVAKIAAILHVEDKIDRIGCLPIEALKVSDELTISFEQMAEIVDYLRQPESTERELFEQCWKDYGRKGSKKLSYDRWKKLSEKDRKSIEKHIRFYVKSNERKYLKDFERYISNRTFDSIVIDHATGQVLFDPDRENGGTGYNPTCGGALSWNEFERCYMYVGYWDGHIADGYDDATRPNGATIMLNNGRGMIIWNKETNTWDKV